MRALGITPEQRLRPYIPPDVPVAGMFELNDAGKIKESIS